MAGGHAEAAYRLGRLHWDGSLGDNDGTEACAAWQRAAELGWVPARRALGFLLLQWRPGADAFADCDPDTARTWFESASRQGDTTAAAALARLQKLELRARQEQLPLRDWLNRRQHEAASRELRWLLLEDPEQIP
jgi:TPR repeat protein